MYFLKQRQLQSSFRRSEDRAAAVIIVGRIHIVPLVGLDQDDLFERLSFLIS